MEKKLHIYTEKFARWVDRGETVKTLHVTWALTLYETPEHREAVKSNVIFEIALYQTRTQRSEESLNLYDI